MEDLEDDQNFEAFDQQNSKGDQLMSPGDNKEGRKKLAFEGEDEYGVEEEDH